MPRGKPISDEKAADILRDAAINGKVTAAELHNISASTVYSLISKYPDFYDDLLNHYEKELRVNANLVGSKAQNEIVRRMEEILDTGKKAIENPDIFKTGTLIGIWETAMKVLEKYARMDALVDPKKALLKALEDRDPRVLKLIKEIIWEVPEEDLQEILNAE